MEVTMNRLRQLSALFTLVTFYIFSTAAYGEEGINCIACHTSAVNPGLHAIWQTPHGAESANNSSSCIKCHGDSPDHLDSPKDNPPQVSFGPNHQSTIEVQSKQCLSCHQGGDRMLWHGSAHQDEDLTCSQCHTAHAIRDKVLNKTTQTDTCLNCHTSMEAQLRLPSRHPIQEGKTMCSDCHNAHGSSTEASLKEPTLNNTCFRCHAEKRGPFLFEHAPVSEDCSLCHQPHGAVNDNLLNTRGPFLCQQCHSAAFHPSQINDGSGLASRNQNMIGKNCLNCHSKVHGTNHPSGGRLTR